MGDTVVGVDIGSVSARAVEVKGFATGKPVFVRSAEVPLPEGSVRRGEVVEGSTVATALRRLWSTGGFKTKDIVLGVGGQRVFARDFAIPYGTMSQIREALPFQVQDLLPVPVADALLDFYPVSEEVAEDGSRMVNGLLVAALKEAVNGNVAAAIAAGLNPVHVDLVPFAISRAIAPQRSARGRDVVVEIGANMTHIIVVTDGVPSFVRMIASGSDDITRAIATRLQWQPSQAETAKHALGMGSSTMRAEDRPILEIIYEVVGELLAGVRNTLSYYANTKPEAPIQRILLSGGGARLTGLPNALADLTGLPVGLADPLSSVQRGKGVGTAQTEASFATAYGLALGVHE